MPLASAVAQKSVETKQNTDVSFFLQTLTDKELIPEITCAWVQSEQGIDLPRAWKHEDSLCFIILKDKHPYCGWNWLDARNQAGTGWKLPLFGGEGPQPDDEV